MLTGTIENIRFTPIFSQKLIEHNYQDDVNNWPTRCLVIKDDVKLAISKWVSPKRTRSYPYSRVYDTFMTSAIQKITIIPLVKDEGSDGGERLFAMGYNRLNEFTKCIHNIRLL